MHFFLDALGPSSVKQQSLSFSFPTLWIGLACPIKRTMDSVLLSVWQWITAFVGDVAVLYYASLNSGLSSESLSFLGTHTHAHMHTHSNTSSIIAVWPALRVLILSWHEAERLPWNCICKSQSPALVSKKKPTSFSRISLFFFILRDSFKKSLWIFHNVSTSPTRMALFIHMHERCHQNIILEIILIQLNMCIFKFGVFKKKSIMLYKAAFIWS